MHWQVIEMGNSAPVTHLFSGLFGFASLGSMALLLLTGCCALLFWRWQETLKQQYALQLQFDAQAIKLREALAQLASAQEGREQATQAQNQFLMDMAHEFHSHLNIILGYTQIFNRNPRISKYQRRTLNLIYQHSEQLLMTLADILDLTKIDAQEIAVEQHVFQFRRFLKNLADMAKLHADNQSLAFEMTVAAILPKRVCCDEKRLRQILLHLLHNAVKFTAQGRVALHVTALTPQRVRFEIEDTGVGIAPEHLKEIFQPFRGPKRVRHRESGTGVNLAISHKLVRLLGSELHLKSAVGEGSCFWFDLDLPEVAVADYLDRRPTSHQISGFKGRLRKVLIADDRYEQRVILKEMLLSLGFEIIEAVDGFEVLTKAAQHQPDAVLLDLNLPVLTGFEAIRHLRQMPNSRRIVIVSISASVLKQIRQESYDAGSDDFLAKPIQFEDLLKCLERHLKVEWVYEQDLPPDSEDDEI